MGKNLFKSVSFYGIVILLLGGFFGLFGFDFTPTDETPGQIEHGVQLVIELVGLVTAVIGTLKRREPIAKIGPMGNPLAPKRPKF